MAIALEGHRTRHGVYPKELAELVPEYFASIREDTFSGKPLKFISDGTKYTLYGVGQDGFDNGGHRTRDLVIQGPSDYQAAAEFDRLENEQP